jgi:hypothetical protein
MYLNFVLRNDLIIRMVSDWIPVAISNTKTDTSHATTTHRKTEADPIPFTMGELNTLQAKGRILWYM